MEAVLVVKWKVVSSTIKAKGFAEHMAAGNSVLRPDVREDLCEVRTVNHTASFIFAAILDVVELDGTEVDTVDTMMVDDFWISCPDNA